jgi:hypothetical protein
MIWLARLSHKEDQGQRIFENISRYYNLLHALLDVGGGAAADGKIGST